MVCSNPIIQALLPVDFKNQFWRDFTFVNSWSNLVTYNTGDQVFYEINNKFYQCLNNGVVTVPTTITDWKLLDSSSLIADKDITNAYAEACISFNSGFFDGDNNLKLGFLYLSAHFLVNDLNAGGLSSSASSQVASRSVGNVSESYSIPQWMLNKSIFSFLAKTSYGVKYLNMIAPLLVGNVASVEGATSA